jgi:YVTN family beta-propeller protein
MKNFGNNFKSILISFLLIIFLALIISSSAWSSFSNEVMAQTTYKNNSNMLPSLPQNSTSKDIYALYSNPGMGITLTYPSQLEVSDQYYPGGLPYIAFMFPQDSFNNPLADLRLTIYPDDQNQTLDDFVNSTIDSLYKSPNLVNLTILEKSTLISSRIPIEKVDFAYDSQDGKTQRIDYYMKEGDKFYVFSYADILPTFNQNLAIFDYIVNSFQKQFFSYLNHDLGVSLDYPPSWSYHNQGSNIIFSPSHTNDSNIPSEGLSIYSWSSQNQTITKYAKNINDILQNWTKIYDIQIINKSTDDSSSLIKTNGGKDLKQISYNYELLDKEGRDYFLKITYVLNKDKLFAVVSFSDRNPLTFPNLSINKITNSFKIIDSFSFNDHGLKTYKNKNMGIAFNYPSDWNTTSGINSTIVQSPSKENNNESLTMMINKTSLLGDKLSTFIGKQLDQLKNYYETTGFRIIELNSSSIGNNQMYKLVYNYNDISANKTFQTTNIYVNMSNPDSAYLISYTEEPGSPASSYFSILQKIIDSLKIEKLASVLQFDKTGIKVGIKPAGIDFDSNTNKLYVANSGSLSISVIDGTNNRFLRSIPLTQFPNAVSIDQDNNRVFVTEGSNAIGVIDSLSDKLIAEVRYAPDSLDQSLIYLPVDIAIDSKLNAGLLFIANKQNNSITVLYSNTYSVAQTIPLSASPQYLAVNPMSHKLYVAYSNDDRISIIHYNAAARGINYQVSDIFPKGSTYSITINPITNLVYLLDGKSQSISVIDGINDTAIDDINLDATPYKAIINPNTNKIYVVNFDGTLSVINAKTHALIKKIYIDSLSDYMSFNSDIVKSTLYITDPIRNIVTAINGSSDDLLVTIGYQTNSSDISSRGGKLNCIDGANNNEINAAKYIEYDLDIYNGKTIKCIPVAEPGFAFRSWQGDLAPAYSESSKQYILLKPVQYGSIYAIFEKTNQQPIVDVPPVLLDSMYTLIAVMIGHAILIPLLDRRMRNKESKKHNQV